MSRVELLLFIVVRHMYLKMPWLYLDDRCTNVSINYLLQYILERVVKGFNVIHYWVQISAIIHDPLLVQNS